jgi:8-oxo-dGTP pyrophosphatase MutT (NUDIX family)
MKRIRAMSNINTNGIQQSAVLAYSFEEGVPKVLMVTSRGRGRWVLPKGHVEAGQSPQEAALCEAFEEAGIKGHLAATKIGTYSYSKLDRADAHSYRVKVYPMEVSLLADDWPEKNQRDRLWMDFTSAAKAVEEPELRTLLKEFGDMLSALVVRTA